MSATRAFETKDIEYPEMYHWNGRFLQFRKGTRLAKAAEKDREELTILRNYSDATYIATKELQAGAFTFMGTHSPEVIVALLNETLKIIHGKRKAQWTKNLV